jgi:hypothetical protein
MIKLTPMRRAAMYLKPAARQGESNFNLYAASSEELTLPTGQAGQPMAGKLKTAFGGLNVDPSGIGYFSKFNRQK